MMGIFLMLDLMDMVNLEHNKVFQIKWTPMLIVITKIGYLTLFQKERVIVNVCCLSPLTLSVKESTMVGA